MRTSVITLMLLLFYLHPSLANSSAEDSRFCEVLGAIQADEHKCMIFSQGCRTRMVSDLIADCGLSGRSEGIIRGVLAETQASVRQATGYANNATTVRGSCSHIRELRDLQLTTCGETVRLCETGSGKSITGASRAFRAHIMVKRGSGTSERVLTCDDFPNSVCKSHGRPDLDSRIPGEMTTESIVCAGNNQIQEDTSVVPSEISQNPSSESAPDQSVPTSETSNRTPSTSSDNQQGSREGGAVGLGRPRCGSMCPSDHSGPIRPLLSTDQAPMPAQPQADSSIGNQSPAPAQSRSSDLIGNQNTVPTPLPRPTDSIIGNQSATSTQQTRPINSETSTSRGSKQQWQGSGSVFYPAQGTKNSATVAETNKNTSSSNGRGGSLQATRIGSGQNFNLGSTQTRPTVRRTARRSVRPSSTTSTDVLCALAADAPECKNK